MIILDKPFVSDFLKNMIIENDIPVVENQSISELFLSDKTNILSKEEVEEKFRNDPNTRLYTNSENAIAWVAENLSFTTLPEKINLFKDKYEFRKLTQDLYPDFYYKEVLTSEFENLDINSIPKPFIIKPSVGFFSMAVYKVDSNNEWEIVKQKILEELKQVKDIYPKQVMDSERFIIEEIIDGDEYAFDAYFDEHGNPVILNVMKHEFASGNDFSDRLYLTSEQVIKDTLQPIEEFCSKVGKLAGLKNFPFHVEIRIDDKGNIKPIEVNPLRFGAWCTTADAAWYGYKSNSILHFLNNTKPNWEEMFSNLKGDILAMLVLENSTGYDSGQIKSFDYEKILNSFECPVDLRKIDYEKYPVFAFVFVKSKQENFNELDKILKSDLKEFVSLK